MGKKQTEDSSEFWQKLDRFLKAPYSVVVVIVAIGVIGYSYGVRESTISCNLNEIKLRQEFNEKIQAKEKECQEQNIEKMRISVDELKQTIQLLRKEDSKNEK